MEHLPRVPGDGKRSAIESRNQTHDWLTMKTVAYVLLGFALGVFATYSFVRYTRSLPPETPVVRKPESVVVFLHPWGGYEAATTKAVRIPIKMQEEVFRRLVPETFYGSVDEHVSPLVAEAVITHADRTETTVLVRDGGHNPAVVSVDGVNYFYAKKEPDVFAGANELIRLVAAIAYEQQNQMKIE